MSGLVVGLVLRTPITEKFNSDAKFIATVYADHAWEDGTHAYPAVDTVATITGLSSRTVQRYLRVLEGIGMLKNVGKGPRGTNRYDFPLQSNDDGSVKLVLDEGDTVTPRQTDVGDTESGDTESGDTSDTQTNNPSSIIVINDADFAKISKLYEQEIGAITPLVSDMILDDCKKYPPDWIPEAIEIAVLRGVRKWSYVRVILKNCKDAGKRPSLNKLENKNGNNGTSNSKGAKSKRPAPTNNTQPSQADLAAAERVKAKQRAQASVR